MRFSLRSAHEGRKNALSLALEERRARGQLVTDLTVSNPTTAGIPYDAAAIQGALSVPESLVYEPAAFGLASARQAVADHLGMDGSRVLLTASTSEAYAFLFKALCDPGDEVLVPAPSYPLFDQLASIESVRLVPYRIAYDGAWHLDAASIVPTARTRAILVVSPNNPTGSSLTRPELARLRATGLPVVADEVFAPYAFRAGQDRVECAAREAGSSLVFSLGGLSKLAGLPQMKLGWIVVGGPEELTREALERLEWIADAFPPWAPRSSTRSPASSRRASPRARPSVVGSRATSTCFDERSRALRRPCWTWREAGTPSSACLRRATRRRGRSSCSRTATTFTRATSSTWRASPSWS